MIDHCTHPLYCSYVLNLLPSRSLKLSCMITCDSPKRRDWLLKRGQPARIDNMANTFHAMYLLLCSALHKNTPLYDPTGVEAVESISTISLCPDELNTLETRSENIDSCCLCSHMNTRKMGRRNTPTSYAHAAVPACRSAPSAHLRSALRQANVQHIPLPARACSCSHWSAIRWGH